MGICEENGGRLCTKEEHEVGCTRGTGCSFDDDLIWSKTGVDVRTSSPTAAPTKSAGPKSCCTWDFYHCGIDEWCNESSSNCHGGCAGVWMEEESDAMACLAVYEQCTTDIGKCCNGMSCVGTESYKQCIPSESSDVTF